MLRALQSCGYDGWISIEMKATDGEAIEDGACTTECEHTQASGNATVAYGTGILESAEGADGQVGTHADNDWRLSTRQAAITAGGIDPQADNCGSTETNIACGNVTNDGDGAIRTLSYSIGAYERDNQ